MRGRELGVREVKFRAWNKEDRIMSFVIDFIGLLAHRAQWKQPNRPIDNYEIMQYTGLKDKNDKEIYEDDIDSKGYKVTWGGDQGAGLGMNAGWYLERGDFESWEPLESRHNDNGDNHEMIGNIHENPELRKG